MNPLFHSLEGLHIVQERRVDEELQRRHPEHNLRFRAIDRDGFIGRARSGAGRGLITLGTWLNPTASVPSPAAPVPGA